MKRQIGALGLLLAIAVLLLAPSALAKDPSSSDETGNEAESSQNTVAEEEIAEDLPGTVSFANLPRRIRENSLSFLALEESVQALDELDYEDMRENLRKRINQIASLQWTLETTPMLGDSYTIDQMQKNYDALRQQYEAIRDGELQQDNADIIRQLRDLEDQIILGGESLYMTVCSLELQQTGLERQLAALDRTMTEMELRYTLGQISALQLNEVKTSRSTLESGLETLKMNIDACKLQLQAMIGGELGGELALTGFPTVQESDLADMDLEKDLAAAKDKSYELYGAKLKLDSARDDLAEQAAATNYSGRGYVYRSAEHNFQSAKATYDSTVQNYEVKFRTLFAQVADYHQIWESAKVSLAGEQAQYEAQELRYSQGTISKNALLTSRDELDAAEDKVLSAAEDFFTTWNTYRWAVDYGVLN